MKIRLPVGTGQLGHPLLGFRIGAKPVHRGELGGIRLIARVARPVGNGIKVKPATGPVGKVLGDARQRMRRQKTYRFFVDRQAAGKKLLMLNPPRRHQDASDVGGFLKQLRSDILPDLTVTEERVRAKKHQQHQCRRQPDFGLDFHLFI